MKILFPVPDPNRTVNNHYVYSLCDALNEQGMNAVCTLNDFWSDNFFDYDIIHFQWPETLFRWKVCHTKEELERLEERLVEFKSKDKRIFLTCHNLHPHIIKAPVAFQLYDLVYKYTDVYVHMGSYSKNLLEQKYPNARHVIIPHHIYDNVYKMNLTTQEAREELKLSQNKQYVLCFGAFRNDEERDMIIKVKSKLNNQNVELLTPGFYRQKLISKPISQLPIKVFKRCYYRMRGMKFSNSLISDKELPLYFCAADIVLIQRQEILNSGNVAMAFHAGRVILGPDTGNVGPLLRESGNVTFKPDNVSSIVDGINIAKEYVKQGVGDRNRMYAEKYLSTECIAKKLLNEYYS